MSHTPELWRVEAIDADPETGSPDYAVMQGEEVIVETPDGERARRIVACVNACAGISLHDLETAGRLAQAEESTLRRLQETADRMFAAIQTQAEEAAKLMEQRDELLGALEYMVNVCPAIDPDGEEAHAKARAAIAKAEAQ